MTNCRYDRKDSGGRKSDKETGGGRKDEKGGKSAKPAEGEPIPAEERTKSDTEGKKERERTKVNKCGKSILFV